MDIFGNVTCLVPTTGKAPQIFASALQCFAAAQCLITEDWPPDANINSDEIFDFIIVGGGTAGCILANRLSEIKHWRVLLIHEGGDPPVESIIPQLEKKVIGGNYTWNYRTAYDGRMALAHINGSISIEVGKMLGGGSNINGMVYVRGNDYDYQLWYDQGNKDWHPDLVRKSFKKAERLEDSKLLKHANVRDYYGPNGLIKINIFNTTDIADDKILASWDEMGFKNVVDINVANTLGSGMFIGTISKGRRESTAKAYLTGSAGRRCNLKIMKFTTATKILISDTSRKAYGVKAKRGDKIMYFYARREVIISAGTINTPRLLMLSGIGPRQHLSSLGISTIVDLPVGQNYHDHCPVPITIYGDIPDRRSQSYLNFEAIRYIYDNTGYYADNFSPDAGVFYSMNKSATYPDFQCIVKVFSKNTSEAQDEFKGRQYKQEIIDSLVQQNRNNALFRIQFILLHPHSRGSIRLKSNNYDDDPIINANYYADQRDLELAVDGIKVMTQIVNTTYFRSIKAYLGSFGWPLCDKFEIDSRDYWRCIILNTLTSMRHFVGTARMGPNPKDSVVDNYLRVHGILNFRVIDASIMPNVTGGNTAAPVIMIAEKGADFIKATHCEIQTNT